MRKCIWMILSLGLSGLSEASVSSNPFLRPGFNQKPPPSNQSLVNPRPIPQKDMSQEIEFRGYFLLKGKPYFCLFNKKSQYGEWVGLSEITYEEFEIQEFDLDSETLSVVYEGKSYDLPLLQSKSSTPQTPSNLSGQTTNKAGLPVPARTPAVSQTPRYMPPKPTNTPTLPPWLAKRKNEALSNNSPATQITGSGGGYPGSVPRRTLPGLPLPGSIDESSNSQPSPDSTGSVIRRLAPTLSSTNGGVSQVSNPVPDSGGNPDGVSESNGFDLENLPPPPPPPNILPPSPPPNIIPSRE